MSSYVIDTHVLHWHLTGDPRLSSIARQLLTEADAGWHRIYVPSIILVEMIYLAEKRKLEIRLVQKLLDLVNMAKGSYTIASLNSKTAQALFAVPRTAVPDMPDRIIVATAYQLNVPLISKDDKISRSGVVTVVW